ncbi:MAG: tryptophanase [Elusimicrobia bacterium]|nr:tryptophanase [Elusimicrobiota bacterium]
MAWNYRTIIEPFKIKSVEPLPFLSRGQRQRALERAGWNLFHLPASRVLLDLLTDSGTNAMSGMQWAGMMQADESYAGARSFFRLEKAVRELTGFRYVIPVHQGRAAERILFSFLGGRGKIVLSNTLFDTTRANIEFSGARAVDLPIREALDFDSPYPFKGNLDLQAFRQWIRRHGASRLLCVVTLTNNSLGGQPVSLQNLKGIRALCRRHGIALFLDAARFAENAYLIKLRERGQQRRTSREIARQMFRLADGCLVSGKKDGLVNMGGFLALHNPQWAQQARNMLILTEGFPTYGGLAGRDLEALAQGLEEVLDEEYLKYRIRSIEYLGMGLLRAGIPILRPTGGHAVYVDAGRLLPQIPRHRFPAQALACHLYLEGGIRAVEIGSLMFGRKARAELLRLAIPRRVYTQSHMDYVIEVFSRIHRKIHRIRGLRILEAPRVLRHFSARLRWV